MGFLDRDTATLVAKSWRVAKNQQVNRVKCRSNITDTAIKALANRCHWNLTSIDLAGCTNITDTVITALATHCRNLTTIVLDGCTNITDTAITALASHCANLTTIMLYGCTNITDTAKDALRNKGIQVND